jgi:hypothetical protein
MAMKLIRSNNQEVKAYEDRIMFHMIKGDHGIVPKVYDGFEAVVDSVAKTVTIKSGMGIMYGHQYVLPPGETKVIDLSLFSSADDCTTIFVEIDCRDAQSEIVDIKALSQKYSYPIVSSDDLISTPLGVARYELYYAWFESDVLTVEQAFTVIENDSINNSKYINRNKVTYDQGKDAIYFVPAESKPAGYVERKKLIYVNNGAKSANDTIAFLDTVKDGDVLEFHFNEYFSGQPNTSYQVCRAVLGTDNYGLKRSTIMGVRVSTALSGSITLITAVFDHSAGNSLTVIRQLEHLNTVGDTLLDIKITYAKIYKILGGNV